MTSSEVPYKVRIPVFEGPLDLLLHLVRKREIEVWEIPIAEITKEYLEYLDLMRELNLEVASEFLLMAATLVYIKSKMLLPATSEEKEEIEELKEELVSQLIEHQRFREAASFLKEREEFWSKCWQRETEATPESEVLLEADLFDLLSAFKRLLAPKEEVEAEVIERDELTVEERLKEILSLLSELAPLTFSELFKSEGRKAMFVTFLAILEAIRLKLIVAYQKEPFGEIFIYPSSVKPEELSW
ncbi:MAG: segregation/condensation protein A [Acidobacteria bacterium]|nr:segregation/condensation protein A [Acidobacteriota bacterium]